jgi:hypothetical protein
LFYKLPGGTYTSKPMTHVGPNYSASVKLPATGGRTGNVSYYVSSVDGSPGQKMRISPVQAVAVKKCDIPPRFTRTYAKPAIIYVPMKTAVVGVPKCSQHSSNVITLNTVATDADNAIVKVVFWYTPYGGTRQSLKLTILSGSIANGNLTNAKFAKLPDASPHTFSGYFIATDAAGRDSAREPLGNPPLTEQGCSPG